MTSNGLTKGVKNALAKNDHHSMCGCGFALPKYPGRYPKSCPSCGEARPHVSEHCSLVEGELPEIGAVVVEDGRHGTVVEVEEGVAYVEFDDGGSMEIR